MTDHTTDKPHHDGRPHRYRVTVSAEFTTEVSALDEADAIAQAEDLCTDQFSITGSITDLMEDDHV